MEPRTYSFSHHLFAADPAKLADLIDAFRSVVAAFEFVPLLRFRSKHLPDWERRRVERLVTPNVSEQGEVIVRTQRLVPKLATLDVDVDAFRREVQELSAPLTGGAFHLARWTFIKGTIERLERLADLRGPALFLSDFMDQLMNTLRAVRTNEPYALSDVEPAPEALEYDDVHPIQLADAVRDCVELCLDPWPQDLGIGLAFDAEPEVQRALVNVDQHYELGSPTPWEMTHNPQPRCALHHYDAPELWLPPGLLPSGLLVDSQDSPSAAFRERYPKPIPWGEEGGDVHVAMPRQVEAFIREIEARAQSATSPKMTSLLTEMKRSCDEADRGHALVGWIEYVEREQGAACDSGGSAPGAASIARPSARR